MWLLALCWQIAKQVQGLFSIVGVSIFCRNTRSFSYSAYMYMKICILTFRGISGAAFHEKKTLCHCILTSHATFVATMSTRKIVSRKKKAKALRERYANTSQEHCGNFKRLLCLLFARLNCERKCISNNCKQNLKCFLMGIH